MRFLAAILFYVFILHSDSIRVDTAIINRAITVQKKFDKMNTKLDSLILILGTDTIKRK